jgi:transcriptional regulator of met regulon
MTKNKEEIINEIYSVLSLKKERILTEERTDISPSNFTFDPNSNLIKELL